MMKIRVLTIAVAALLAVPAMGVPITYLATLQSGDTVLGDIPLPADGNGWDNPESWDWYRFFAEAGNFVNIEVDRLTGDIDPVSSSFFGEPEDTDPMVTIFDTPAGAVFVASGDDDDPPNVPGPFGDPNYSFNIANTGWYATAVGNYLGEPNGPGEYDITITGQTPEPATISLFALGGLALLRRRR